MADSTPRQGLVMTEAHAIGKYTLVPFGLLVAAVVATTAVTNYLWADKTVVAVLTEQNASLRREFKTYKKTFEDYKAATDGKLDKHMATLHGMDVAIKLIAQKLEVDLPDPA